MAKPKRIVAPLVVSESTLYLGHHLRAVDNARVILPPDWRVEGAPTELVITPRPAAAPGCLLAMPVSRWEAFVKHLEAAAMDTEMAAFAESMISDSTSRKAVDSYGRLALPEDALQSLGIGSEAMLVGRMNKFEIWDPGKYQASRAKIDLGAIAKIIDSIRV